MTTDNKIIPYDALKSIRNYNSNSIIVLTTGCYDLMHLGHIIHLSYCKSKGDILVVSIGNDQTVESLKGLDRPIFSQQVRARMIASLAIVDYVVISEEEGVMDHSQLVKLLHPNIYVISEGDTFLSEKKELIEHVGGLLDVCERVPPEELKDGISTTSIIKLGVDI